tara:strand:+ start:353 stop:493 length:141 start_codon:yes stop_codon:yes gene_type:complete
MTLEFFQSTELVTHSDTWKTIIGLLIVLFAFFVSVEIKLDKNDKDS